MAVGRGRTAGIIMIGLAVVAGACSSPTSDSVNSTSTTLSKATTTGAVTSFGNGTYSVGTSPGDVAPATYRTSGGPHCSWAIISSFGPPPDDFVSDNPPAGPDIVTLAPTAKGFRTDGCGTWTSAPYTGTVASTFGDGTYAVGVEIRPGAYRAPGGPGCSWARLFAFGEGNEGSNYRESGPGSYSVIIPSTDLGFETRHCGTWTPVG